MTPTVVSETKRISIVDGPSKFDWITAFADRFGDSRQRKVEFTLDLDGVKLKAIMVLDKLGHEDGSGNNWLFWATIDERSPVKFTSLRGVADRVEGHYNTKRHCGTITRSV